MFVYATAGDADEARRIGRAVVEERLAACANVIDGMKSIYWWQGAVQEGNETVLILKTTEARVDALISRIKALHSYDCPAIVSFPIAAGFEGFLDWIEAETLPTE
jgi:periplasmic divalent cation tolerance protein